MALILFGIIVADRAGWFDSGKSDGSNDASAKIPSPKTPSDEAPSVETPPVTPSQDTTLIKPPARSVPVTPVKSNAPAQIANSIFMKFVLISAGTFTMGDDDGFADEKPAHKVTITRPFYLLESEVSQGHWETVMGTTARQQRDAVDPNLSMPGEGDNLPMYFVSWDDTQCFCQGLSAQDRRRYRLSTEADWEYVCRAGSTTEYCFGDSRNVLDDYAWSTNNSGSMLHPVESKYANRWGLYDMHGSVWEWCSDYYAAYPRADQVDPAGRLVGTKRVLRGGSWANKPQNCRSPIRLSRAANIIANDAGFRVVMELP